MSATSSGRPSTTERICGIDEVKRINGGSDIGIRRVGRKRILGCLRMPFFSSIGSIYTVCVLVGRPIRYDVLLERLVRCLDSSARVRLQGNHIHTPSYFDQLVLKREVGKLVFECRCMFPGSF